MKKFRCVCGEVISTSGESPHEWLIIREQTFGASWDAGESFDAVFQKMQRMYICPRSGHLWIFWSGFEKPGTCYEPGSNAPIGINGTPEANPSGEESGPG